MDDYKPAQTANLSYDGQQYLITGVGSNGQPVRIELSDRAFNLLYAQAVKLNYHR